MLSLANETARRLRLSGYVVVAYLTIGSFLDILISAQPPVLHDLRWRLGVGTLLTNASGTELLGAVLFLSLALMASDAVAIWTGFVLSLLLGLLYVCVAGVFTLDSLQLRGQIRADMLPRYNVGFVWTVVRLAFTGLVLFIISGAFVRAARYLRRSVERNAAGPASTIVVGTPASAGVAAPSIRPNIERPKAPVV